ncbi:MAG: class II aldolase/adducin family protein [Firmicutes bacterium]|nr:class II aldolase/adducin family protein [Bacillota bacterium]
MRSELELKQDMVEVGRRIWLRGYVAANDGNISVRIGPDEFLCTPTGVSKGFMTPEMIIKVNGVGKLLSGSLKPSSEIKMHLRVYRERPDVKAVVHAHPPICAAFAVAGIPLNKKFLPEVIITLGEIPLAEYATPSTDEVPESIAGIIKDHDAVLLANHGALTLGGDVFSAYYKLETMEHFATVSLAVRQLGGERELPPERVAQLMEVRNKLGLKGTHPGCKISREENGPGR